MGNYFYVCEGVCRRGLICTIAQIIINFTDWTAARYWSISCWRGGTQGLGLYQYLVDFAGAGATVFGAWILLNNGAIRGSQRGFSERLRAPWRRRARGYKRGQIFVYHGAYLQIKSKELKNGPLCEVRFLSVKIFLVLQLMAAFSRSHAFFIASS
ncbi:MAG: SpoVA/SpoVAEb family sporulation membrane protein [Christensenellaceae bacterium]